jgi:hypothetical protein
VGPTARLSGYVKYRLLQYSIYGGENNADMVLARKDKVKRPLTASRIIFLKMFFSAPYFSLNINLTL